MTTEMINYGRKALSTDTSMSKEAGAALAKTGAAGLALGVVAWMIPFVSLPMLLFLSVFAGAFLYIR